MRRIFSEAAPNRCGYGYQSRGSHGCRCGFQSLVLPDRATSAAIPTPNLEEYGYGWVISSGAFGKQISHEGEIPGFVSGIARYPDSHSTVILLSSDQLTSVSSVMSRLGYLLFKQR